MAGYEECAPEYLIERGQFPFWTLEFIAGGTGYLELLGKKQRLGHGSLFTYGPEVGVRCWNDPENTFRKYFMVFPGNTYPVALRSVGLEPGSLQQVSGDISIIAIIDQLLDEAQLIDGQTSRIVSGLMEVLLGQIQRHLRKSGSEPSLSRQVYEMVLGLIRHDFRELNSLEEVAKRSGYSGEYICRIFRNYHGRSPYQVLIQHKMSAAWLRLRDGEQKVGAIAKELGYEDPLHFSRVFRKTMGCSPSSVRPG